MSPFEVGARVVHRINGQRGRVVSLLDDRGGVEVVWDDPDGWLKNGGYRYEGLLPMPAVLRLAELVDP